MLGPLATLTLHRGVQRVRATADTGGELHPALDDLHALIDSLADDRGGHGLRPAAHPQHIQGTEQHRGLRRHDPPASQPDDEREPTAAPRTA